jgi:hypothetical protein
VDATSHESDERLELYALGRLTDSDLISIEEHLLRCDACRDRLDESAGMAFALREAIRTDPVPFRAAPFEWLRLGWLRPQFALAGALAMVVLAVVFLWRGNSGVAPVASLQLTAMRGVEIQTVPSARELDITFGDAGGAAKVEVVDGNGSSVWGGAPEVAGGEIRSKVVKVLAPGDYFARVYDSAGHMLHEYGFRVKRKTD